MSSSFRSTSSNGIGNIVSDIPASRATAMGSGIDLAARRRDGSEFPVEISLSHLPTRTALLAVAFVSDITERNRAEAAIRESEETVRALLESASQGIIGVNEAGTTIVANAITQQLFGYDRDELLSKSLEILVPARAGHDHAAYRDGYFR